MNYSIVIPVFNKAALTRQCLETLQATLQGAGDGEVIVVDNASSDETPQMLREFSWVRVIRNEENRGFAGANNQGARAAHGKHLVLLNNDIVAHEGWLAKMLETAADPGVGVVGARLLFPGGKIQHAGVRVQRLLVGAAGLQAFHDLYMEPGDLDEAQRVTEMQIVTGACLLTPRDLYISLGGLDEGYWNGYEDVDYCLRVRERGLRVVYDGRACLTHFESQSGAQRYWKVTWNIARLAERWNGRVDYDDQRVSIERGVIRRVVRGPGEFEALDVLQTPKTTVVIHGDPGNRAAFEERVRANHSPIQSVVYARGEEAIRIARAAMEVRGDRYLALVDARVDLPPGWLDRLIEEVEFSRITGAATYAPQCSDAKSTAALAADARCTLLALARFPQHLRLEAFATLHGSLADLLLRAAQSGTGVRACAWSGCELPELPRDPQFESRHGVPVADMLDSDVHALEAIFKNSPRRRPGLVSIVMLSWNASEFTKMALESIRAFTNGQYEVIVVDNGSREDTVAWLRTLENVHVIYNPMNRGYAGGNNQGIAAARGEYVVLLNNDVIVTDGWLDGLLGAFDRIPGLGVSAVRSNKIAGDQATADSAYTNLEEMHAYARSRREAFYGEGYFTDRAIGLCLCVDRQVIEEIGGIDERFGAGNFEDDDFCLRVRAAGYRIFVCDDVFIHHFGSQTFAANKIDWNATMRENWAKFAHKWGYPQAYPESGYATTPAIRRGFDREKHFVMLAHALPSREAGAALTTFIADAGDDRDWNEVGAFVRRYLQAFRAGDSVALKIAAHGSVNADLLGNRIMKLLARLGIDERSAADVEVEDVSDPAAWAAQHASDGAIAIRDLREQNPAALRRLVREGVPG